MQALPLVKVVATGGTIANTPSGRLHAREVAEAIPELKKVARLDVEEIVRVGSHSMTIEIWLKLAKRINEICAHQEDVKGIVVTHGTNSLEETGYFLNLTIKSAKPVVLTAAQRRFTTLSSDSPKNFLQAVRVAASDQAAGKGVLVVANDTINAAREVTKTISSRVETYSSRDIGLLGYADDDQIIFYRASLKKHTTATPFDIGRLDRLPRVDILYTYVDADGILLDAAVNQAGAKGLVIAGFASGSPTPVMEDKLKDIAAKGIAVALSQRAGMGRVKPSGSRPHLITADNLTPQKARILLMLGLTQTKDVQQLQAIFREF